MIVVLNPPRSPCGIPLPVVSTMSKPRCYLLSRPEIQTRMRTAGCPVAEPGGFQPLARLYAASCRLAVAHDVCERSLMTLEDLSLLSTCTGRDGPTPLSVFSQPARPINDALLDATRRALLRAPEVLLQAMVVFGTSCCSDCSGPACGAAYTSQLSSIRAHASPRL